jgi:hypothetical protein
MADFNENGEPIDDSSKSSDYSAGFCETLASKYSDNDKLAKVAKTVDLTLDKSIDQHGVGKVGVAVCLTGLLVSCCSVYINSNSNKSSSSHSNAKSSNKTKEAEIV